jgi:hypothetical protein
MYYYQHQRPAMQPKLEPMGARQELVGCNCEDGRDTQKDQAQRDDKCGEYWHQRFSDKVETSQT